MISDCVEDIIIAYVSKALTKEELKNLPPKKGPQVKVQNIFNICKNSHCVTVQTEFQYIYLCFIIRNARNGWKTC